MVYPPHMIKTACAKFRAVTLPRQEKLLSWLPCFQYNRRPCAKKRVGHAYICLWMDIGQSISKLYPPPETLALPRPKRCNFGGEIVVFALKFGGNRAKIALFSGQKFVTPFSTLANNQRSLPTYSTMPDHS